MMRVLFTTNPGPGHWHPLVPFAETLQSAGHQVAFATAPSAYAAISALRFRCFPAGEDEAAEEAQARRERATSLSGTTSAAWNWQNLFAGAWAERRLPDLINICQEWDPAVLVREDMEFAGCIAAEQGGLPHAAVQVTAWRPWFHPLIAAPLNRLREDVGLTPDQSLAMLYRFLLIVPAPPSYFDPAHPLPPTTHAVRPVAFDRSGEECLPDWVHTLPDRPVVYATMGTAFNRVAAILQAIVDGLRGEPITLIVTTGRDQDPASFGPQPPNVHIERYVPQSLLFPHCDLIITHGGSGTVMSALGHGLPMVIVPVSADQPDNAQRCAQLGLAKVVAPDDRSAETFRDAAREVLRNSRYRQNAERLREEMARLPGPEHAVGWLERLTTERRSLVTVT